MFARSLTKIASIGTFFIDYSLTAFIDAAFSGSEAAYWNVYQDYYEDRGLGMKPMTYWRDELMKITNSTEPENVSALIEAMTLKYLSQIWDDEAGLAILMKDHGKISFGGLNEDVKTKIMNKYKALFYEETIIPAMKMLEGAYEEQMALEREMALNDLENQVRKAHMVEINFDLPSSWESHLMLATDKVNCGLVSESGDLFFDGKSYREVAKNIDNNLSEVDYYAYNESHRLYASLLDYVEAGIIVTQVKVDIPLDDGNFHTVMLPLENEYPGFQSLKVIIPDNALTKEGSDEEEALEEAESVETEDETIKGQGIEIEIDDLSSNMNNAGEPFIVNELKYQNLATKVIDEILNLELDKVTYSESDYGQTYQAVNEDGSGIYLHKSLANDKGESQINYQSGNTEIYESIALTVNRANEVISLRYENSDGIMAKGGLLC